MDEEQNDESTERKQMRQLDTRIALSVAGFAGLPTRDRHGNISTDIWTKYNVESVAKLLDIEHMRRLMTEQLTNHLEARKDLLLEAPDQTTVVQWIFGFTKAWEKAYREDVEQWDIAQMILTTMEETICEVKEVFDHTEYLPLDETIQRIGEILRMNREEFGDHELFADSYSATIRFLFRNKFTGPPLIRIAGKKLQKQLVCNRSGAYSARVQRNDVTQEKDDAITALVDLALEQNVIFQHCSELIAEMQSTENARKWLIDHKKTKSDNDLV
tara:strand:+ start:473 stop:1288 length:816 start_codon:yes stop_codon:yes gene_type:complete